MRPRYAVVDDVFSPLTDVDHRRIENDGFRPRTVCPGVSRATGIPKQWHRDFARHASELVPFDLTNWFYPGSSFGRIVRQLKCLHECIGLEIVKLRAQITIDIQAADFADAANHQRRVEALMETVLREYRQAALLFRERRDRPVRGPVVRLGSGPVHHTGRMHEYDQ